MDLKFDFSNVTKLVFDGIALDVKTIMPIQHFLDNNWPKFVYQKK